MYKTADEIAKDIKKRHAGKTIDKTKTINGEPFEKWLRRPSRKDDRDGNNQ